MNNARVSIGANLSAADCIEDYLERVDAALQRAGASLVERSHVVENLRSQITEMLVSHETPTANDAKAVISKLDLPEEYAFSYAGYVKGVSQTGSAISGSDQITPVTNPDIPPSEIHARGGFSPSGTVWFSLLGILLPAIALVVELTTRVCTTSLFNPLPTVAHTILVAFVPSVYLWGFISLKTQKLKWPRAAILSTGMATGIALMYVLPFLPVLPISIPGILFMGIGLLPYAPLAAFLCGFWLRKHLFRFADEKFSKFLSPCLFGGGVLTGVVLLMLCYLPAFLINSSIRQAAHGSGVERKAALERLQILRGEDETHALAYAAQNRSGGLSSGNATMGPWALLWEGGTNETPRDDARSVYYRLTGKPFNSVPPPAAVAPLFGPQPSSFERNPEMRDGTVGWIDKDLTLKSSRIDSIADAATATGYVEWTMTFHNATTAQREARSQILLPPGGVVSRLTLWVNGEEREAAFAAREKVKEAYEKVVARQQDPVLITTSGPDRILMQCFPVPPGGLMKIRIGITHPLLPESEALTVALPRHIERNYDVPAGVKHSVWLDADADIKGKIGRISSAAGDEGRTQLSGQISEEELASAGKLLLSGGIQPSVEVADLLEPEKYAIVQTIAEVAQTAPDSLVIVLDTSLAAKPHLEKLIEVCRELPDTMKLYLLPANDEAVMPQKHQFLSPREVVAELQRLNFQGGQDNLPALKHAVQFALKEADTAIAWIHGPQAVELTPPDDLIQLFERSEKTLPAFYEVLLAPGPDRVVGAIERYVTINFVPGVGDTALAELGSLFSKWKSGEPHRKLVRTRRELAGGESPTSATRAGDHVARLWAFGEAMRLFRAQKQSVNARTLAVNHQLVTPFTGAVVLETEEQYNESGLKPVDPGTVPTIPEPEEWALILIAITLFCYAIWKSRRLTGGWTTL